MKETLTFATPTKKVAKKRGEGDEEREKVRAKKQVRIIR